MTEVGEGVFVPGMAAEGSEWDNEEPDNWVELEYFDAHGNPVAGAKYVVLDLNGKELASGTLDGNGFARVELEPKVDVVEFYFDDDPEYVIDDEYKPKENPNAKAEEDEGYWESTKQFLSDAAEWTWGVLQGDFNEDPSISQIVVRAVITLIPIVDQIGDVQDIIAALKKLIADKQYDDWEVWFALVVTLIGCIPEIGTIFKAVAKLLKRGAKSLDILKLFRVLNWVGAGNAFRFLKKLRGDLGKHAADVIKQLDGMLQAISSRLLDLRQWVSSSIEKQIDELVASIGELRAMVPGKVNEVFDYLGKRIDEVLESAKRLIHRRTTREKWTINQQKERLRDEKGRFISDPDNPPSRYKYTDAQRRKDWKRLAEDPNSGLTDAERAQIRERGWRGPQRVNEHGELETMELSHEPIPLRDGGTNVVPRWPPDHAAVDPHRRLKKR